MEATFKVVPLETDSSLNPAQLSQGLVENVSRVVIGKRDVVTQAVVTLLAGGHVLLEDVPGSGKTPQSKAPAKTLSGESKGVQSTAALLPPGVTGVTMYPQERPDLFFPKGPLLTNALPADESTGPPPGRQ